MDVSGIPWRLTEALVAELSVCFALGWSLYEIYSVKNFDQSRHLAKTKLHPEYPHRKKKRMPPLSRKLVFFANRNTQKNMQLLDKIHTVFTTALNKNQNAPRPSEHPPVLCLKEKSECT